DGIAAGNGRSGVAASYGKCQGKVAGAEDGYRAERPHHGANVGARERLALGLRGIDARGDPRALFDDLSEEAKLVDGARRFALQARLGQRGLTMGALDNVGDDGFDTVGDAPQKSCPLAARGLLENDE